MQQTFSNDSFLPEGTSKTGIGVAGNVQYIHEWKDIVTTKDINLDIDGTDVSGEFQLELTQKTGFNEFDYINSEQYREKNPGNELVIYQVINGEQYAIADLNVPTSNVDNVFLRHVNTVGEVEDAIDNFRIAPEVEDGLQTAVAVVDLGILAFTGVPTFGAVEVGVTIGLEAASMIMVDDKKLGEVEVEVFTYHSTNPALFDPMTSNTLFFDSYSGNEKLRPSDKIKETQHFNYDR